MAVVSVAGSDCGREVVAGVGVLEWRGSAVVPEASVDRANDVSASMSAVGSARPRFAARRRMPFAARGDSENLGGADGASTSARRAGREQENPSASLRDVVVASIEDPVGHPIPEVPQRTVERGEIGTAVR